MNKLDLMKISFGFILISGLLSCSKENSAQPTDSQVDNFEISEPILHAQFDAGGTLGKLNIQKVSLASKPSAPLYPLSVIEFPSLANHSFTQDPLTLDTIATCDLNSDPNNEVVIKKTFRNIHSLQLLSFFDAQLTEQLSHEQKNLKCQFDLTFTNKLGSTEHFRYTDIDVHPLDVTESSGLTLIARDENSQIAANDRPIVFANQDSRQHYPTISNSSVSFAQRSGQKLWLTCENFVSEITTDDDSEVALSKFNLAKIIWKKDSTNFQNIDPRVAQPEQYCRVMSESGDVDKSFKFSRRFQLVQQIANLKISMAFHVDAFSSRDSIPANAPVEIVRLDIFNNSDAPATLIISGWGLSALGCHNGHFDISYLKQSASISTTGGEQVYQNSDYGTVFTFPAKSNFSISYGVVIPNGCFPSIATYQPPSDFMTDIRTRVETNLQIFQVANPLLKGMPQTTSFVNLIEQTDQGALPKPGLKTGAILNVRCPGLN